MKKDLEVSYIYIQYIVLLFSYKMFSAWFE